MFRFIVRGIVQGVGFRPYILRKAREHGLLGHVKNIGSGVEIEVDDHAFLERLTDLPPLARIISHTVEEIPGAPPQSFTIHESISSPGQTILPADIFTCDDCIRELGDEGDRRNKYYFITCTNCGPRFSMIADYPYDRPNTSMSPFKMCPDCTAEYTDPSDRRYHAQTIACKNCGPKLALRVSGQDMTAATDYDTISSAAKLIGTGEILAIKGVGGFHICCLPKKETVAKVRKLLGRPHKPFALMVRDALAAKDIVKASDAETEVLQSPERPILVLKKKEPSFTEVSELDTLGMMLPYTALHHLLFDFLPGPLVMTSCNVPGEPVALTEGIADNFLTHERAIVNRCDDSVIKYVAGHPLLLRRSRGFAPLPVSLPIDCADTVSVGAEINNACAVTVGGNCFISQYIGDTAKAETMRFLRSAVDSLIHLTRAKPLIIACDMHPLYNSTAYAKKLAEGLSAKAVPIQHHMAHVASCAAEHGLTDYVGIAVDGLGYGDDGGIWGGEIFTVASDLDFSRIGSLMDVPQLGGDAATKDPKKMLFGILSTFLSEDELVKLELFDEPQSRLHNAQLAEGFNAPMTSSAGRVLDAAAALVGLCDARTYDGRPAMVLESHATIPLKLEPEYKKVGGRKVLDTPHLMRFLLDNREKDRGRLAATAQTYLSEGLYGIADQAAAGLPIVMSGGVAYNRMISSHMLSKGVALNRIIPAGDGGICFGQAFLANKMADAAKI